MDYYFIQQDGTKFKCLFKYAPYFYVIAEEGLEREVESVLRRKVLRPFTLAKNTDMYIFMCACEYT